MEITNEIFESYLNCKYKAFLKLNKESGNRSEFEELQLELRAELRKKAIKKYGEDEISQIKSTTFSELKEGKEILTNLSIEHQGAIIEFDILERVEGKSKLGDFHYIPIFISDNNKITKDSKLIVTSKCIILGEIQGKQPEFGKIIYGDQHKKSRIRTETHLRETKKIIQELTKIQNKNYEPKLMLNKHCQVCEFRKSCKAKAVEKDDLSLLDGVSEREINNQNNKGIFTVTQYSYTYRPRKQRKSKGKIVLKHYHSLKALAIRDNKIYVVQKPNIPTSNIVMFFDVEGDPDRNFYYLIGLVISQNGQIEKYSFWADDQKDEEKIWAEFIKVVKQCGDFIMFHYGSYETKFIKTMIKKYGTKDDECANKINSHLVNLVSFIYSNIYFPTYSNSLKDIGKYLGCVWTEENSTGLQSLIWRKKWDTAKDEEVKKKLITYNMEDCIALKKVTESIIKISSDETKDNNSLNISLAENIKVETTYKFGPNKFLLEELEFVNKCAYFDYQRERVYFRRRKVQKETIRKNKRNRPPKGRINKKIEIPPVQKCEKCDGKKFYKYAKVYKTVFDLRYFNYGIKRWVVEYSTMPLRCKSCNGVFLPDEFTEIGSQYGYQLMIWVVYQIIVLRQTYNKISENLRYTFNYRFSRQVCSKFKEKISDSYKETYDEILEKLVKGKLIHADETSCKIRGQNAYIWIFTSLEEVVYIYSPTREADVLKETLDGFMGVLVSDFYPTYDSIDCIHQKCLVHLIRDMNDDLRKNPFNEEYKSLIKDFSELLMSIIVTIDRFGLKKRNLNKHKKQVGIFFKKHLSKEYESQIAIDYQKKFRKYQHQLFTFLDYDDIPWNNNNAEHAIKAFAPYRKINDGYFTEKGIREYLILLSIYQTCVYKEVDFLKLLLSKERDIDLIKNKRL